MNPYPREFSGEPSSALIERWQWTYPIVFFTGRSPSVLFTSSQHVWRTTNGGQTWDRISGDLTRHDPKTMGDSGGPITHDMNSPEVYATVFALGPGKTDVNVLWAGSDDGLVHVTRDAGKTWANVTPKEMPDLGRVSIIDASAFDAGSAYVAVKKPLLNDMSPYIFRTHDYGKTWTKIVTGIPARRLRARRARGSGAARPALRGHAARLLHFVRRRRPLGRRCRSTCRTRRSSDIAVEANDIAIATHGRGFYILDNVGALRQAGPAVTTASDFYLFAPGDAIRGAGGATITYLLRKPAEKLTLDILDRQRRGRAALRRCRARTPGVEGARGGAGQAAVPPAARCGRRSAARGSGAAGRREPHPGAKAIPRQEAAGAARRARRSSRGCSGFTWDLQYAPASSFPGMILWGGSVNGPAALPGAYQVRLTVDGRAQTQPLAVKKHPLHTDATDADLKEQFDLAMQIRDKVSEANNAVIQIRKIKEQVDGSAREIAGRRLQGGREPAGEET